MRLESWCVTWFLRTPSRMASPQSRPTWSLDRVLARLALQPGVPPTRERLAQVYRAWSRGVPFTNLDKLAAVRAGAPLPSLEPDEIFARFLETGACGTCFTHAVAFRALLGALGFEAQNYAGHTTGTDGVVGQHATTIVSLKGGLWLVDTALPHGEPLPLHRDRSTRIAGVMTPMEAHPHGELWRLECLILHNGDRRTVHLEEELRDTAHAAERWRRTLDEVESPFNKLPVARLELADKCLTLAGRKLFTVGFDGQVEVESAGSETLERFGIDPTHYAALWQKKAATT